MRAAIHLALLELSHRSWNTLALIAVFGIAVAGFLALGSYRESLVQDYPLAGEEYLIAQESQSFGEFHGSRLAGSVGELLEARGVEDWVPEIHTIVGTSPQDVVLLRGVSLGEYASLDVFEMAAGRPLQAGDPPRTAMVGSRLAEAREVTVGEQIHLRGRPFEVVGIFESGSYTENEAWVPLAGAQELLGWGGDVSLFVFPNDGKIEVGEELADGVSVARRGELWPSFAAQWTPILELVRTVNVAIGLAAAGSLAVVLGRVAWDRRWQVGVLRAIGFGPGSLIAYIGLQGVLIASAGSVLGAVGALALTQLVRVSLIGVTAELTFSNELLLNGVLWLLILCAAGIVLPGAWLSSKSLVELLQDR